MGDWKLGTVARIRVKCRDRDEVGFLGVTGSWHTGSGSEGERCVSNVRPLTFCAEDEVAIKAEDLRSIATGCRESAHPMDVRLVAALDAYDAAKKPAVEEPTGLGAVVEDGAGNRWTRIYGGQGVGTAWYCDMPLGKGPDDEQWVHWVDVNAVRVLSPGVEADV